MELSKLSPSDFEQCPVWEFLLSEERHGDLLETVETLPVNSLTNRIAGTRIRLSGGAIKFATFANVDLDNPYQTRHFLTLSIWHNGGWLHLSRYHDPDYERHGPSWFADELGLRVNDVFPIAYDLRSFCIGHSDAVTGLIPQEISEKLSRDELLTLVLSGLKESP